MRSDDRVHSPAAVIDGDFIARRYLLKLLSDQRDRVIRKRTGELSRIHSFMVVLRPGCHGSLGIIKSEKGLQTVTAMLRGDHT